MHGLIAAVAACGGGSAVVPRPSRLICGIHEDRDIDDGAISQVFDVGAYRDTSAAGGVTDRMTHSLSLGRPRRAFMAQSNSDQLAIERPAA